MNYATPLNLKLPFKLAQTGRHQYLQMMTFDLPAYLTRIDLEESLTGLGGLKSLQRHQISAIPFENVLPFSGQIPDVTKRAVWDKLIARCCGGYCFELNTLLGQALEVLNYAFRPVLARVRMGADEGGIRNHLAFVVTLDGVEWLVDAGFGGQAPAEPLRLDTEAPQDVGSQAYRIRSDQRVGERVLERQTNDGWFPLYGFDRVPPTAADIDGANYLCATWPESSFPSNLKFYRLTTDGRISFLNGQARYVTASGDRTAEIASLAALTTFMTEDMGLKYDAQTMEILWNRLEGKH